MHWQNRTHVIRILLQNKKMCQKYVSYHITSYHIMSLAMAPLIRSTGAP